MGFNLAQRALLFITCAPASLTIPHDFIRKKKGQAALLLLLLMRVLRALGPPPPNPAPSLGRGGVLASAVRTLLGHLEGLWVGERLGGASEPQRFSLGAHSWGGRDAGRGSGLWPQGGTEPPSAGRPTCSSHSCRGDFEAHGSWFPGALLFCISAQRGQALPGGVRLLSRGAGGSLPTRVQIVQVNPGQWGGPAFQEGPPLLGSLGAAVKTNSF